MLALVGVFYPYNRGALFTALVVIYALTSGIAGYTATSFYIQLEGSNWVRRIPCIGFCSWFDCIHFYNSCQMKLDDLYIYLLVGRLETYC